MSSRNVIDFLAHSAPSAIGYLQVPLTPSTAAQLADFTARTGVDPQTFVLELLEDAIFDISGSVVSGGDKSCVSDTRNYPQSTEESNARSCKALHDCAALPSDEPARDSGPTKLPRNSPHAQNAACAQPDTSFPAIENPLADQSLSSSLKYPSGRCEAAMRE